MFKMAHITSYLSKFLSKFQLKHQFTNVALQHGFEVVNNRQELLRLSHLWAVTDNVEALIRSNKPAYVFPTLFKNAAGVMFIFPRGIGNQPWEYILILGRDFGKGNYRAHYSKDITDTSQ
jgi:hypothetical protein